MGLITYENLEDGTPVTANIFNERFAQIIAQLNGNIDENNLADEGISKEKLQAEVYESLYPVGSMYVNFTDNTNPGTLLGFGTWTAVAGKFVAGYDGSQTEFNASEKTGGDKEHTHTLEDGFAKVYNGASGVIVKEKNGLPAWNSTNVSSGTQSSTTASRTDGAALGGSTDDGDSLPPYIVGYVWKRVS